MSNSLISQIRHFSFIILENHPQCQIIHSRLIFSLLIKKQLYIAKKLDTKLNIYSNIYRKDLVIVYLSNTLFYQNISKSFLNSSYHITGIQFSLFSIIIICLFCILLTSPIWSFVIFSFFKCSF